MIEPTTGLTELNERTREIFRRLVETYLETGTPVGSRNLARHLPISLSPASVRNVMADLEALGLIFAPHTSAGRIPTQQGLRLFVDGLLEIGDLTAEERQRIESQVAASSGGRSMSDLLGEAGAMLSGLSHCAGIVLSSKADAPLKHIEFVHLDAEKALVVLVSEDGSVENRIIDLPPGVLPSALIEASNFLNARIRGRRLDEAKREIESETGALISELDALTAHVVHQGLATWSGDDAHGKSLIVRGRSNLLEDLSALEDLERVRLLFDDLEKKNELIRMLGLAETAEGVRIFIGSENTLFSLSGSSLIVSPYHDSARKIVGVLGVIGPTRLNYARIIPMVDYTAKVVGRLLT